MAKKHNLPKDADFWREFNFGMLAVACELQVLCLEGVNESVGIRAEVIFAAGAAIPTLFIRSLGERSHVDVSPELRQLAHRVR